MRRSLLLRLMSLIKPFQLKAPVVVLLWNCAAGCCLHLAISISFGVGKPLFVLFVHPLPPCWGDCWGQAVVTADGHGETWLCLPLFFLPICIRVLLRKQALGKVSSSSWPAQADVGSRAGCGLMSCLCRTSPPSVVVSLVFHYGEQISKLV